MPTIDEIKQILTTIIEPEQNKDIITLNMVKRIDVDKGEAMLVVELPRPDYEAKDTLESQITGAVKKFPDINHVSILTTARPPQEERKPPAPLPGVNEIVAVYACKGGVGKSTVSTNLAVSLASKGKKVGLFDADIHGPNIPLMMGVSEKPAVSENNRITPLLSHGVKVMSLGLLKNIQIPLIWRGPMVHGAILQMLRDTDWGELDTLIIDLPPGTGDAQLTIIQSFPLKGVVLVTTPQTVSLLDGAKGIGMFQKLNVPILGLIENMSGFTCPHCEKTTNIFSSGGGQKEAKEKNIPFLGTIPLDPAIVAGGDSGQPIVKTHPNSIPGKAFLIAAEALISH